MRRITQNATLLVLLITLILQFQSCSKKQEIGVNPYAGAKEPFGIVFTKTKASPESGLPGEVLTLDVKELYKYKDKFKIYLNEVEAEVVNLTEKSVDIRIPQEVSSGRISVVLDNHVFFGPNVGVEGKAAVDVDFKIVNGFNGYVSQILPNAGGFLVTGGFTNFENERTGSNIISSIHFLNSLGQSSTGMSFRRSAIGSISSVSKLNSGRFIVAGNLTSFSRREVGGITRLLVNGNLDTVVVPVINPDPIKKPLNGLDTVATFNGSLDGSVLQVFGVANNNVIAVGYFANHSKIDYSYSSRENRRRIYTKVRHVAKMRPSGFLDSTFNINNQGFNGIINNAMQLNDGRIVIVGKFTTYNGKSAKNIVCLKPNGDVDEGFAAGGADNSIFSITYNKTTDKIAITGDFKQVAGVACSGLAILNANGNVDQSFQFGTLDEGYPAYAYSLNNGRVFVQGSFKRYNNVRRSGMLILESNGEAKQEYNNLGAFVGAVNTLVETTSSLGNPAILLGGFIFSVDGKSAGNIIKIELKN